MPYPIQKTKKDKIKLQNLSVFIYCVSFSKKALFLRMANVAQLVRASDCESEGRGFKTHHSPHFILGLWLMVSGNFPKPNTKKL